MNSKNPTAIRPSTPSTRDTMTSGNWLEKIDTAIIQVHNITSHNNSEPSCPPQTAAMRYMSGSWVLECCATYNTEKSLV